MTDEEIEKKRNKIENSGNLPAKEDGKIKKFFKKFGIKIAVALGITSLGAGVAAKAIDNSKSAPKESEVPVSDDFDKNNNSNKNNELKGELKGLVSREELDNYVSGLGNNLKLNPNNEKEISEKNEKIELPSNDESIYDNTDYNTENIVYDDTPRIEDLNDNQNEESYEELAQEVKEAVGLEDTENTPMYSVDKNEPEKIINISTDEIETTAKEKKNAEEIAGKPAEVHKIEITKVDEEGKEEATKTIEVVAEEDVEVTTKEDNDGNTVIAIEGDGEIEKIGVAELQGNVEEKDNGIIKAKNPFEEDELDR